MDIERLDPRRNAYREDLADERLHGRVEAERFVTGENRRVKRASVALRVKPDHELGLATELRLGDLHP